MWAGHQCLCTLFATLLCQFPGPMRLGCLSYPSTSCPGWGGDTNIFRVSLFLFFWPVPDCLKCTNIISLVKWVNPVHLPLWYCAGDSWGAFCNIHGQNLCPSCFVGEGEGSISLQVQLNFPYYDRQQLHDCMVLWETRLLQKMEKLRYAGT